MKWKTLTYGADAAVVLSPFQPLSPDFCPYSKPSGLRRLIPSREGRRFLRLSARCVQGLHGGLPAVPEAATPRRPCPETAAAYPAGATPLTQARLCWILQGLFLESDLVCWTSPKRRGKEKIRRRRKRRKQLNRLNDGLPQFISKSVTKGRK